MKDETNRLKMENSFMKYCILSLSLALNRKNDEKYYDIVEYLEVVGNNFNYCIKKYETDRILKKIMEDIEENDEEVEENEGTEISFVEFVIATIISAIVMLCMVLFLTYIIISGM